MPAIATGGSVHRAVPADTQLMSVATEVSTAAG